MDTLTSVGRRRDGVVRPGRAWSCRVGPGGSRAGATQRLSGAGGRHVAAVSSGGRRSYGRTNVPVGGSASAGRGGGGAGAGRGGGAAARPRASSSTSRSTGWDR